jgi:hypothetical protein
MAKLEKKPKKKPRYIRKGHINYSKKKHWRYDKSDKKWVLTKKGRKIKAAQTKTAPKPPAKTAPEKVIVRTARSELPIATHRTAEIDSRNADTVAAFKALSSVELYQYLNNKTIEGLEDDNGVGGIVNSIRRDGSRRQVISPIIPLVKNAYINNQNVLVLEFNDTAGRYDIVAEFYTKNIQKINTTQCVGEEG